MQRSLSRRRAAVAREDDGDSDAGEDSGAEEELLRAAEALLGPPPASDARDAAASTLAPSSTPSSTSCSMSTSTPRPAVLPLPPARLASSGAQLNLHAYDAGAAAAARGYTETKIGGHALDHRRPFLADWRRRLAAPVRAAVASAADALGAALGRSPRSSRAFDARERDVLVYASVKIAGHAMDHVPFLSRGQPSRPLWGYVPNLDWSAADGAPLAPSRRAAAAPRAARVLELEPNALAALYDCSRCLRLRQAPRVQLCCGHGVCAACASSRSIRHAELGAACFLDCARCGDLVAVEAVEFTNHVVRLQPPPARSLAELEALATADADADADADASRPATLARLGLAWRHGGVIAVLSFLAGRLFPAGTARRRTSDGATWHGVRRSDADVRARAGEPNADEANADEANADEAARRRRLLLDDVAGLATRLAPPSADELVAGGAARWAKRVQGLQTPSKLLQFAFVRTLGAGRFGEVMLVRDRRGALSVLKESDKLPEAVNEMSLLARVRSPHVVRMRQYFVEEVGHRHLAYIEMEYCDAGDLLQRLRAEGSMPEDEFAGIFRQLCVGLQEIHDRGIVHRDLKPSNVLMTTDGVAKIADFGVSTSLESDLVTHHAAGTLAFMAPEVRRYFLGEDVSYDTKADVWSLGALAVAMLTGNPEPRVATRPLDDVVEDLQERGLSDASVQLVERALQPQPEKRSALADLLAAACPAKARL